MKMRSKKNNKLSDMKKWEMSQIAKHGFYVHQVICNSNVLYDCHTHGLVKSFGHNELQIVLTLDEQVAMIIMHILVDKIKNGTIFMDGDLVDGVIKGRSVKIVERKDSFGDVVMRVIFPDPNGSLNQAEMIGEYAEQYDFCC